tara:strand:- start:6729 stop:7016 length:288 start_codon:yes stop_codon:yes gene_type:complete
MAFNFSRSLVPALSMGGLIGTGVGGVSGAICGVKGAGGGCIGKGNIIANGLMLGVGLAIFVPAFTIVGMVGGGVVGATFPVSVPYLLYKSAHSTN